MYWRARWDPYNTAVVSWYGRAYRRLIYQPYSCALCEGRMFDPMPNRGGWWTNMVNASYKFRFLPWNFQLAEDNNHRAAPSPSHQQLRMFQYSLSSSRNILKFNWSWKGFWNVRTRWWSLHRYMTLRWLILSLRWVWSSLRKYSLRYCLIRGGLLHQMRDAWMIDTIVWGCGRK